MQQTHLENSSCKVEVAGGAGSESRGSGTKSLGFKFWPSVLVAFTITVTKCLIEITEKRKDLLWLMVSKGSVHGYLTYWLGQNIMAAGWHRGSSSGLRKRQEGDKISPRTCLPVTYFLHLSLTLDKWLFEDWLETIFFDLNSTHTPPQILELMYDKHWECWKWFRFPFYCQIKKSSVLAVLAPAPANRAALVSIWLYSTQLPFTILLFAPCFVWISSQIFRFSFLVFIWPIWPSLLQPVFLCPEGQQAARTNSVPPLLCFLGEIFCSLFVKGCSEDQIAPF
jgi:hypothetical protein